MSARAPAFFLRPNPPTYHPRPWARRLALVGAVLAALAGAGGGARAQEAPTPGVEVLARGPVHEAFATPTAEAKPTMLVNRQPPVPLDELPPEERPEGEVVWISGYYAWDDDRQD